MAQVQSSEAVRLDGRTLEGGGQLIRIAVALSALTGQPVTIDHIRGNRSGKKGLKASHLAAIKTLGELTGSTLVNAQANSCSMGFYPPLRDQQPVARQTDSEINIRLPTPESVFLVFQALYPYLLHSVSAEQIRLSIIGGSNVSSSPSFDYVAQVLIPNFARVGLPPISTRLEKRGWSSSGQMHLGKVIFLVDTLRRGNGGPPSNQFPSIGLHKYRRGTISKIDITILAPDDRLREEFDRGPRHANGARKPEPSRREIQHNKDAEGGDNQETVREFMERHAHKTLRKQLRNLPPSVFSHRPAEGFDAQGADDVVPIETHTTEATHRRSCLYVLIVAHTSTGFRMGRDALYGAIREEPRFAKRQNKPQEDMTGKVMGLVEECVERFVHEIHDPQSPIETDTPEAAQHQPCVDKYMRDQLVVFEALGRASGGENRRQVESQEDERYWSLHTKTAQWVCREMLGASCFG